MVEVWNDEINVKEIMKDIRERTLEEKRMNINGVPNDVISFSTIRRDLEIINNYWNVENESYAIFSHRKILGPILVRGRKLVHGEVRRYVDPVFQKQREFNAATARILNEITRDLEILLKKVSDLNLKLKEIEQNVNFLREIANRNADIERNLEELKKEVDRLRKKVKDKHESDYCYLFEDKFRGPRELIMERFRKYLKYFEGCKNVLDIGCGRGEFLELCKKHGIVARGIDINEDMVKYCQSRGLDVLKADALEYLKNLKDKSLDGIFIAQVVEHLEPDYLIELLKLCYRKLKFGYYIVIETVNPLSLTSLMNFYLDLTHNKPIHPETIKFLLEYVGFRDIKLEFYAEIPSEAKLIRVNPESFNDILKEFLQIYNKNIDILNNLLFGAQDYAIVGRK